MESMTARRDLLTPLIANWPEEFLTISKRTTLAHSAHYLPNYKGKCANLHGHSWEVELGVRGPVKEDSGMVVDFEVLKNFLAQMRANLDHKSLNDILTNPTAENICLYLRSKFYEQDWGFGEAKLHFIRVWETKDSMAEWRA